MFKNKRGTRENPPIDLFTRKELVRVCNKGNPVCVNIEINQRCAGGCLYCYAIVICNNQERLSIKLNGRGGN